LLHTNDTYRRLIDPYWMWAVFNGIMDWNAMKLSQLTQALTLLTCIPLVLGCWLSWWYFCGFPQFFQPNALSWATVTSLHIHSSSWYAIFQLLDTAEELAKCIERSNDKNNILRCFGTTDRCGLDGIDVKYTQLSIIWDNGGDGNHD
jgi:hypothetical protein